MSAHNTDGNAHGDIRAVLEGKAETSNVYSKTEVDGKMTQIENTANGALLKTGGTMTGDLIANNPDLTMLAVRNIQAGTQDLISGSSPLPTGVIYLVYE